VVSGHTQWHRFVYNFTTDTKFISSLHTKFIEFPTIQSIFKVNDTK